MADPIDEKIVGPVKEYYETRRDEGFEGSTGILKQRIARQKMADKLDGFYHEWLKGEDDRSSK